MAPTSLGFIFIHGGGNSDDDDTNGDERSFESIVSTLSVMAGAASDGDDDSGGGGGTAVSFVVLDPSNSPSFEMSKEDTIPSVHILSKRGGILLERIIVVEFTVLLC